MRPSTPGLGEAFSADELLAQIDQRIAILRPLVEELNRLEAARAALEPGKPVPARPATATPRPPIVGRRAPRGANRAAILALAGTSPGITVAQLADATGIAKATVHSTVYALTRRGEVERSGNGIKLVDAAAPTARPARPRRAAGRRGGGSATSARSGRRQAARRISAPTRRVATASTSA